MRTLCLIFALALGIWSGIVPGSAEEVTLDYLGLELAANLEIAQGRSMKNDGVVLLVHDTLGHHRMEVMAALQDSLRDLGVNSLAITLGLGMDKRHGMFACAMEQDHRHEDAIDEIVSWVAWLKEKGASSITLAGHGRGANQAALYSINKLDKSVKRLVLLSPLMQNQASAEAEYKDRFHGSLRAQLTKAEELVANEQGNQLMDVPGFLTCPQAKVTASTFADYYGANPKFQTTNLLQSLKLPALIEIGESDPNSAEITAAHAQAGASKNISVVIVPGTDRDFRDEGADEAAKKIKEFIGQRVQG